MGGRSSRGGDFAVPKQWKLAGGGAIIGALGGWGPKSGGVRREGADLGRGGGCSWVAAGAYC
ncbi:hypothetical protein TIFTF001_012899 [Ficus carica]|uniref:Uncharacterized protein n=1 Tax=Ficus carica TaxID=3494 RepID=A0AA88A2J5_FICCA|nr:hypothetical protein TIFTF001_012899 [Ficus carica]